MLAQVPAASPSPGLLASPAPPGDASPLPAAAPTLPAAVSSPPAATPTPAAAPNPGAAAAPEAPSVPAGAAPEPEPDCNPRSGDICLSAEKQEQLEGGHFRARGQVDLRLGSLRIQADNLDLYNTPKTEGGAGGRRIKAEGNVVFMEGDERLAGEKLDMDLDTHKGTFEDALGYVSPGVLVEARKIERVDANTYRIEGGKFTSCTQPNPRWSFSASSAVLDVDDKIRAKNVLFKVKDVPAFYIPYFIYPIQEDQRSTGFLFPHFGHSSTRGFNIGTGFFWAMGRSLDQTFYLDRYSSFGFGVGHEFRYRTTEPSHGEFRSYGFRRSANGTWEHDLDYTAVQRLPLGFKGSLQVREYSNLAFEQEFQDSLDLASQRTRRSALSIQRSFGPTTLQLLADSVDTFFDEQHSVNRHLPALRVTQSPQRIKRTGIVFSYEARGERLGVGNQERVNQYSRVDLNPRLSRPFSTSFLQVTPEVQVRYTRYGASITEDGFTDSLGVSRRYFETSVDSRGPTFSRVFSTPGNFYSDRFKHVIGPEVTWTYRTSVDEFDAIPRADYADFVVGTNEFRYGIVQRFYAKRRSATGKPETHEFLNWRILQTYYANVGASEFDPNYSTAFFGATGEPAHFSPLQSRLRVRPTPVVNTNFDLEYDVNFKSVRSLGLNASVEYPRVTFLAGWFRGNRLDPDPTRRKVNRNTLRGSSRLELVPNKWSVEGSADYDVRQKNLVHYSGRARYDVQCCGFMVEVLKTGYSLTAKDRQIRFAIELANIGSIGNFMGEPAAGGGGGGRFGR